MKLIIVLSLLSAAFVNGINNKKGNFITGGALTAHAGQFPFVASIHHSDKFICGGALIGDKWVLTTALCIWGYQSEIPSRYFIRVGTTLTTHSPGAQYIQASKVYPHPNFHAANAYTSEVRIPSMQAGKRFGELTDADNWVFYGNIGLIELAQRVIISITVMPISMAFATEVVQPGSNVIMAGWGGKNDIAAITNLEYTNILPTIDMIQCKLLIPGSEEPEFDIEQICTAPLPAVTACEFDHGGPLFRFDATYGTVLLGVVNYAPCNNPDRPTVFASVPSYRYWIFTITGF